MHLHGGGGGGGEVIYFSDHISASGTQYPTSGRNRWDREEGKGLLGHNIPLVEEIDGMGGSLVMRYKIAPPLIPSVGRICFYISTNFCLHVEELILDKEYVHVSGMAFFTCVGLSLHALYYTTVKKQIATVVLQNK